MIHVAATYGVVLLLDRLTKMWAIATLTLGGSVPVAPFLHMTLVHNYGAAFGLLPGASWLLILVRAAVSVGVFPLAHLLTRMRVSTLVGLGLIGAGSAGNLIDGLRYGYVVDFLDIRVWPVFNVADMAIVSGGLLLAWQLLRAEKRESQGS